MYNPLLIQCLSHVPSNLCPTKSNVYFTNRLATALSDLDLYRLLTFHVSNLMSVFHFLCHCKGYVNSEALEYNL